MMQNRNVGSPAGTDPPICGGRRRAARIIQIRHRPRRTSRAAPDLLPAQNIGSSPTTVPAARLKTPVFSDCRFDVRVRDITHGFVIAEIARDPEAGRTVLLCDGSDKSPRLTHSQIF